MASAPDQTSLAQSAGGSPPPDAGKPKSSRIAKWLGAISLGGAILAILIGFISLTLARYDMIEKISGFIGFMGMLPVVGVTGAIGLAALVLSFVLKTGPRWQAIGGIVLSAVLALVMYTQVMLPGGNVPPIHDITTDLDNPPQFSVLDRPEVSTGPFTVEEWRAFHEGSYGDIAPILIDKSPTEVLANAHALMESNGWEIVKSDPENGLLEGTAYAGYLKFKDDVLIEVTPVEDGSTRVDMRSVSQVGVSDLGYNAARVRAFLAELQGA